MRAFIDSCVLIDSLGAGGNVCVVTLRHLRNEGVELTTSITVLGECLDQCITKGFDPLGLTANIGALDMDIIYPRPELRTICIEVDEHLKAIGRYGSSCTDRTHFAYALLEHCDLFITSSGEKRTLDCPHLAHRLKRTRPVTIDDAKMMLGKASRRIVDDQRSPAKCIGKIRKVAEASTA